MPGQVVQYKRHDVDLKDTSDRFRLSIANRQFNRQYAHIYAARLWTMRQELEKSARETWGNTVTICKLSDMKADENCVIIGTLFKSQRLKPSVLKELAEELSVTPQPVGDKFVDEETDELYLEDELQRIILVGLDIGKLLTGVVVAAYGKESSDDPGKFIVEKPLQFYPLPKQEKKLNVLANPKSSAKSLIGGSEDDRFVVLVSGFDIGSKSTDSLSLQLLIDLLTGQLGDLATQRSMARVVRVIIAGNSLAQETRDRENASRAKYLMKKTSVASKDAVGTLDEILVQLASAVEVDLMPGEFDPTTYTMPQQPLHRCLFPLAHRYPTMHCRTNPYQCELHGITILGTSGQPVHDIYRFSTMDDHLEILESTLTMGHISPTSPDTLACYPYADTDPFIFDSCPHIYFTGNSPRLSHKIVRGEKGQVTLLVTVPRYSVTHTCVAVNLRTLECHELGVDVSSLDASSGDCQPSTDRMETDS